MSSYNARRGPNVSQYIANLNQVPSAQEMASQKQELFNFDDDLFNNAEFFDFDMGTMADVSQQPIEYDPTQEQRTRRQNASAFRQGAVSKPVNDFLNGEFISLQHLQLLLRILLLLRIRITPLVPYPVPKIHRF